MYYEARQHLNLSQQAYDVIAGDQYEFLLRTSFSGMLNRVFSAYVLDSRAAIEQAEKRYRETLEGQLAAVPESPEKNAVLSALLTEYRAENIRKANSYPRECQFKFQLSRENYAFLQTWKDPWNAYDGSVGRFIKAVIEEYAEKPFSEREIILLRQEAAMLQGCIDEQQLIIVTTGGSGCLKKYEVRPYQLCTDRYTGYHYLTGISKPLHTEEDEIPASFRLSRIRNLTPSGSRSGHITQEQKKLLNEKIRKSSVSFLLQDAEKIEVRLTAAGEILYSTQHRLRPLCMKKTRDQNENAVYTLSCTRVQALFYFFKFGADAEILSPSDLRAEFIQKYRKALECYRD